MDPPRPKRTVDPETARRVSNGNRVATLVTSNFPGVRVQGVNPTTGYVTVDLSKADRRTRRMVEMAGSDHGYYLYEEPGKPAVLQVIGSAQGKRNK